jgi:hypothetical protein
MTQKNISFRRVCTSAFSAKLFLVSAFPLHVWTLLMAFRDFAWVAARTYTWDAIGLVSYALVAALLETMAVFLLVWLAGFLVPFRWDMNKRLAMLGTQFLVVASWSILSKIYTALDSPLPIWLSNFMIADGHPLRILWAIAGTLVTASAVAPAFLIMKRESAARSVNGVFDRIVVLSSFYLILDLIGILIIVIRNIH